MSSETLDVLIKRGERRINERKPSPIADEFVRLRNEVALLAWERDQLLTRNENLERELDGLRARKVTPLHQVIRIDHLDDEC